jgi:uncharacterized delta-60 repeat protein
MITNEQKNNRLEPPFGRVGILCLGLVVSSYAQTTPEFNLKVEGITSTMAVQLDGKILVGGSVTALGAHSCTNLGRLNADGTPDTGFAPATDGFVWSLLVQSDGRILVGGEFSTLAGRPCAGLGRLFADGSYDTNFNPVIVSIKDEWSVRCLEEQADGKILLGGFFAKVNGQSR